MARWTDSTLATTLAGDDVVLMADVSEAAGTRDRRVTLAALRTFLGAGITVGVTQASHGLSVGDVVRFDGTDYVQATADTAGNAEAVGVVTLVDGDDFAFQTAGVVSTLSGLTPGDLYYLQDDGSLGTSSGTVEKPVLIATSATTAVLILAVSSGASAFTDLTDAPASFAGAGGKLVAVNSGATALEFVAAGGAGDVSGPSSATDGHLVVFDGTTGKLVKDGGAAPDPTIVPINAQTGTTYTLVLADAGKLVTLDNGSAITLTVPTNASVAYAVGTVIALAQLGAGLVSVAGDTGVTINGTAPGDEDLTGRWATATLTKLATNTWLLSGGVA